MIDQPTAKELLIVLELWKDSINGKNNEKNERFG